MPEITATDTARGFSDLLDAVEHEGERYTVVRHGRAIAHIEPIIRGTGTDIKKVLRNHPPDADWADDLSGVRALLEVQHRA